MFCLTAAHNLKNDLKTKRQYTRKSLKNPIYNTYNWYIESLPYLNQHHKNSQCIMGG